MRPSSVAVLLAVAWLVITVAGALVLQALAPTGTLWPLIVLHVLGNVFAAVGALPAIPILVGQDVVLLVYGLLLVRGLRSTRPAPAPEATAAPTEAAAPAAPVPLQRRQPTQRPAQP
jgi:hypothetical protein